MLSLERSAGATQGNNYYSTILRDAFKTPFEKSLETKSILWQREGTCDRFRFRHGTDAGTGTGSLNENGMQVNRHGIEKTGTETGI